MSAARPARSRHAARRVSAPAGWHRSGHSARGADRWRSARCTSFLEQVRAEIVKITRPRPSMWSRTIRRGLWASMGAALLIPSSTAAQEPGDPQQGRQLFEQNCAMCHDSDASGMMGMHPSLRGASERLSREGVEVTIRNGRDVMPPMPAFEGRLSDEEISDVIAYLDTLPVGSRNFGPGDGMMDGMGDMMGRSGMGSTWFPWLLVGVLAIALIGMVIALIARSRAAGSHRSQARRILEERYARGEIDHDEFQERRSALSR